MINKTPFFNWQPLISPEEVFIDLIGLSNLKIINNELYWLEFRPSEKGRTVLVKENTENEHIDITPNEYYIRTRVHEYGGRAYTINKNNVYFVNFQDQCLYQQNLKDFSDLHPLTPKLNQDGSLGKFGSLELTPDGRFLVFIYEKEYENKENENYLACLDLKSDLLNEPIILHEGYDFYGVPKISPDGRKIAWLTWSHPNMPWDEAILWEGDFNGNNIDNSTKIINKPNVSICFPEYDPYNKLYFIMDEGNIPENDYKNWWNLYCYDQEIFSITKECKELGEPLWWFGERKYIFLKPDIIISSFLSEGKMKLCEINKKDNSINTFNFPFTEFSSIAKINNNSIALIAAGPDSVSSIYKYYFDTEKLQLVKKSTEYSFPIDSISKPEWITYKSKDNSLAFGHLYLPKNQNYDYSPEDKPPLIVRIHGGPTARNQISLSLITQFWTSSGYAVFDIDYHGSTGYGRTYRDSLKSKWGIIDICDIKYGIEYLQNKNLIDNERCAITGGSAGGYAVQRVLTMFPNLFQAGASYFGIGNLITLVKGTHKFESKYINTLVGGTIEDDIQIFKERSPKNYLENLKAPMIIFQGKEDKIVTPDNSREMAEILTKKGIENYYIEYEEEAHGFRIKDNKIDALKKEADFYKKVFKK